MNPDNQSEWCQISGEFVQAYQEWKENLIKKNQNSFTESEEEAARIGVDSVYEKAPPMPGLLISKKQILNQSSLLATGGGGGGKPQKWRLTGDFFGYLKRLEDQNVELQSQLDKAVSQLERTQLQQIRQQNNQKDLKETMNNQMIHLVAEYKKAEREHQVQMKDLADTCQALQQELAQKSIALEQEKSRNNSRASEIVSPSSSRTTVPHNQDKTTSDSNNGSMNQIKTRLVAEQSQNMYLTALCDKSSQELKDKEKEVEQLWARVYELHENLKIARESEIAFQTQSIAIEELREQLELARTTASVSDQASIIEAMLPATNSRLQRTDQDGWEWTPWVKNVTSKALEVDFNGIMEEFKDLRVHRNAAFTRAKSRGMDIVNQILKELGLYKEEGEREEKPQIEHCLEE